MNKRIEIAVDSILEDIAESLPFEGTDRLKNKLIDRLEALEKEAIEEAADVMIGAVVSAKGRLI